MEEQAAIDEKFEQLKDVVFERVTPEQLAATITKRRISWLEDNLGNMLKKYENLSPEEAAYNIIFFEHMHINPAFSHMIRMSPTKIMIHSYGFCPYLKAGNKLSLDTRFICKEIGEPSLREMAKMINPNIRFSRDYETIRPYSSFCKEFFELV